MEQLWQNYVGGQINWHQTLIIIFLVWATQLVTWAAKKAYEAYESSSLPNSHDLAVMNRFRNVFKTRVIDFMRTQDFSVAFPSNTLDSIGEALYYNRFESPDFKFHDTELEGLREQLMSSLDSFWEAYGRDISSVENNVELIRVHKLGEQFDPDRTKYMAMVTNVNSLATDLVSKFDALTARANRKFNKKR